MQDKKMKPGKPAKEVLRAERKFTTANNPGVKQSNKPRVGTNRGTMSQYER